MINYILIALTVITMASCEKEPLPVEKQPLVSNDSVNNDTISTINDDPAWLKSAKERIELHRKADLSIHVVDNNGKPIEGAEVEVKMIRHAFEFGSLLGTSRFEGQPNPTDAQKHLEIVETYFNKVAAIRENDPVSEFGLNWLNERNIKVRGHYLMWARIQPGNRYGQPDEWPDDEEELRKMAFQRIEDMITWADNRITEWNLINHIVTNVSDHVGYDHLFGEEFFADIIKFARELAPPEVEMWINEGGVLPGEGKRLQLYYEVIENLVKYNAKPDGIGFMSHFKGEDDLISMEVVYQRLDKFAELVPNLQLTELDIDVEDEKLHASYLHDVMNIAFSHPAVTSITVWQIWGSEGHNRVLWNSDWTIKPAGEAWIDLVHNKWWTEETGITNNEGQFEARGFLGDYEIHIQVENEIKTMNCNLLPEGTSLNIVF
ncbi:MAG: endo-1,4-beta-xylanase [Bacteroidales bacterium]